MPIKTNRTPDGSALVISIQGRFDFSCFREFRQLMDTTGPQDAFIVDLKDATYVDSSALGMLLLLREKVNEDRRRLRVVNASGQPRDVLALANFAQLMELL